MAGMDPFFLIFLKLTITGSLVAGHQHVNEALDLAARGLIKPRITVKPFKEFPSALKLLVRDERTHRLLQVLTRILPQTESKVAGRVVIDFNK